MSDILFAKNIVKKYRDVKRELVILDGLDLTVAEGEILAITGHSGVGKSTLLHILGLLDTPTSGSLTYAGTELTAVDGGGGLSEASRAKIRNTDFGFVFQFFHLLPDLDAIGNIMLPAMVQSGWIEWSGRKKQVREKAEGLLSEIGLSDRMHHKPSKLSGGEKQRIALARALINSPKIVFCDEPTGNLDEKTSEQMHELIWNINEKHGMTFVIVTHNEELARRSTRIARMHEGKIRDIVKNKRD